jgi:hypothetical protein
MFGVAPLVGTLLCLLLPETANTTLPDTLEDGENFGKYVQNSFESKVHNCHSRYRVPLEGKSVL